MKKVALLILIAACIGAGGVRAEAAAASSEQAAALKPQTRCDPAAGSRISRQPDANGNCPSGSALVRTYSAEELKNTGQTDLGQALQQLDPSVGRFR